MHPPSGSLRLLCEIGAALGADFGPPLPPAPSGSRAAQLEICDDDDVAVWIFGVSVMIRGSLVVGANMVHPVLACGGGDVRFDLGVVVGSNDGGALGAEGSILGGTPITVGVFAIHIPLFLLRPNLQEQKDEMYKSDCHPLALRKPIQHFLPQRQDRFDISRKLQSRTPITVHTPPCSDRALNVGTLNVTFTYIATGPSKNL
jgi:hypothetical protein